MNTRRAMPSKTALRRRTFLRGSLGLGAGALVGLPLLEAMLNTNGTALADGSPLPMQLVMWFMGNGYRIDQLEPATTGADFSLSAELQPLSNVSDYVSIASGLQNWSYKQITHHEGMTAWSGYNMAEQSGLFSKAGGPTLDQVIADQIEADSPVKPLVKSVQLGISKRTSIMDSGTTMYALSHRGTNEPLFPEFNPQKVYQTLFGEYQPKPDDSALRLSVLDSVKQDAAKLNARLGAGDKQRLDAHLEGIRQLEERIKAVPPTCDVPGAPTETNADVNGDEPLDSVNKAMSELLVYAMKCDITRIASCMFIGGAAETTYAEIGQQVGHHYNTHDPSAQAAVHSGVVYAHSKLAYLLEQMKATVDPMGTSLLDSGLVLAGSDCSVGLTHSVSRQPYIMVGKLRDRLRRWHYQATPFAGNVNGNLVAAGNTSDVLFTILKAFHPGATSIGDMTPTQLKGSWYGTNSAPGSMAPGSSQVIPELTGPNFGT